MSYTSPNKDSISDVRAPQSLVLLTVQRQRQQVGRHFQGTCGRRSLHRFFRVNLTGRPSSKFSHSERIDTSASTWPCHKCTKNDSRTSSNRPYPRTDKGSDKSASLRARPPYAPPLHPDPLARVPTHIQKCSF